jgi:adenosylcobinamide-phosphate synthase
MRRRAGVLAMALVFDLAAGDLPDRWHPVAWFGAAASNLDRRLTRAGRRDTATGGTVLTALLAGGAWALGWLGARGTRRAGLVGPVIEALILKQALALRGLLRHADAVRVPLEAGDLERARQAAGRMVSRPTSDLPAPLVASAAVESVAENLSDSVVAPGLWYLAAGLPGALAYRAANTLDAMVGYRARGRFGMVPARLDDLLNLVPARLTAGLLAAALPGALGRAKDLVRDAGRTASPNAGWPMAAMAHGLGVRLEKREHHILNPGGKDPGARDIARAGAAAARAVALGGALLGATLLAGRQR